MSSHTTETFPYTLAYVCDLLKAEEAKVLALCSTHHIQAHRDERTGRLFFGLKDVDLLREALEAEKLTEKRGASRASQTQATTGVPAVAKTGFTSAPQRTSNLSRAEISMIVESVSTAKEEILRDLSQLLDDKLSGLDEIVVELIRSKSENDTLREELKRLEESKNQLQSELARYKPAAFGFYRREG